MTKLLPIDPGYEPRVEAIQSQNDPMRPEKRLLCFMIFRAVLDLGAFGEIKEQAEDWFFDETQDENPEPFSFPWVCQNLPLCPKKFRSLLKEGWWKKRRRVYERAVN